MEKISQIETIKRAFLDDSKIDEKILLERREICNGCEYNSHNKPESELTLVQRTRKKLHKEPFCIACGCQILEKTSQETEECGLGSVDKKPKWFRLVLETTSRMDLDLINNSSDKVNVDLTTDNKSYQIDFGTLTKDSKTDIEFLLNSKSNIILDMTYVTPSCGACTNSDFIKINDYSIKVNLSLNLEEIPEGEFSRNVYLGYYVRDIYKKGVIKLVGIKK